LQPPGQQPAMIAAGYDRLAKKSCGFLTETVVMS